MVIALVGPVGSGVSTTAIALAELLEGEFGYTVETVKVSDIINDKVDSLNTKLCKLTTPSGYTNFNKQDRRSENASVKMFSRTSA